jgi:hypothetical protein
MVEMSQITKNQYLNERESTRKLSLVKLHEVKIISSHAKFSKRNVYISTKTSPSVYIPISNQWNNIFKLMIN